MLDASSPTVATVDTFYELKTVWYIVSHKSFLAEYVSANKCFEWEQFFDFLILVSIIRIFLCSVLLSLKLNIILMKPFSYPIMVHCM